MSRIRAWLDATPLATIGLALMREATGRTEPQLLEPLRPTRPERLRPDARIGFWALGAGVGTSTTAALLAQRSAVAGHAPLLVDLDRWAPSLALRARVEAASIADALVQPDREAELVSRWAGVSFLPGSPELHRDFDGPRIAALLERLAAGRALVVDLGSGPESLDPAIVSRLTRLVMVAGPRASQLQAAFSARQLLRTVPCAVDLVVVGTEPDDAALIASRVQLPLAGAIPLDAYLARDEFAARAPTMRSIDRIIASL
jgi:Mrp family chromosome partitioning ATPase